jgi:hypothetical protein
MQHIADFVIAIQEQSDEVQRKHDNLLERSAADRQRAQQLLNEAERRAEACRVDARFFEMYFRQERSCFFSSQASFHEQFALRPRAARPAPLAGLRMPNSAVSRTPRPLPELIGKLGAKIVSPALVLCVDPSEWLPAGDLWQYEMKHDAIGHRCICWRAKHRLRTND